MTSTMVQGSCNEGKITVAMKGNGREVAQIIRKLMCEMAEGLNCSLKEVANSIINLEENVEYVHQNQMSKEPGTIRQPMNEEVASFFKRKEAEPIRMPEAKQEPVQLEEQEPEFYEFEDEVELTPEPEAEPILNILMKHGIDSVYERKIEHSLPDAEWFDCTNDTPAGKYYLLLENKKATSPKDKLRISSAMRINGKWALSSQSKVSLSDCNTIAYTEYKPK